MISCLELAALCGVSHGTVDRAMHGRAGVSAATRARILAMAEAHGYRPNPAAREMMGRAVSTVVGVAVPSRTLSQPFFMDLFGVLARHLQGAGLQLCLWVTPEDTAGMEEVVTTMAARRLRALLLVGPPPNLHLTPALLQAQPVIALNLPCVLPQVRTLMPDEFAVGRVATEHLIALGHRRIVHLMGDLELHPVRVRRRDGYLAAMAAAALESRVWPLAATAPGLIERLQHEGITAVFCHHDPMAIVVLQRLAEAGIRVPDAISIVGVDHSPILAAISPGLTSVAYPYEAIAAQVIGVIAGQEPGALPTPQLVMGRTSGPCP